MVMIREIQFVPISSEQWVMINLLTGAADIISGDLHDQIMNNNFDFDDETLNSLLNRRYAFSSEQDYYSFLRDFDYRIAKLEAESTPNFVLVPSYTCNLSCTYCYEQTYEIGRKAFDFRESDALIDRQFEFIKSHISEEVDKGQIRITIMGGEPLLVSHYSAIEHIVHLASENGFLVDVVTNGVELNHFVNLLQNPVVEHIQVTVDGIETIHDKRRIFRDGRGSFQKIIGNVQDALNNGIKVSLRVNLDEENISTLPQLAELLLSLKNQELLAPYIYLLQDGGCSGDSNVIRESAGIVRLSIMEKNHPGISIFSKRYHPKHLIDAIFLNEKFKPCLKHCGASTNQYILDCNGYVYKCWHGIGNIEYACGQYYPTIRWNEKYRQWKERSVLSITKCQNCKYRYICGGGCPAASHTASECFDITKESCVDYETLIDQLVKIHMDRYFLS